MFYPRVGRESVGRESPDRRSHCSVAFDMKLVSATLSGSRPARKLGKHLEGILAHNVYLCFYRNNLKFLGLGLTANTIVGCTIGRLIHEQKGRKAC